MTAAITGTAMFQGIATYPHPKGVLNNQRIGYYYVPNHGDQEILS